MSAGQQTWGSGAWSSEQVRDALREAIGHQDELRRYLVKLGADDAAVLVHEGGFFRAEGQPSAQAPFFYSHRTLIDAGLVAYDDEHQQYEPTEVGRLVVDRLRDLLAAEAGR